MQEDNATHAPVDPVRAGLTASCPRCGQGRLFDGFSTIKPRCTSCGLDFSFIDAGDGPAIFVILLADLLVVGLAVWTELTYSPPVWVHFVVFGPMAIIVSMWMLRTIKALLAALQYKHNARQGTIDRG